MKHLNVRLTGRVQGVCFRDYAQQKARQIGVNGIIRNEPDGSVYAEAEGNEEALEEFLQWLKKGPSMARVDNLASQDGVMKNYDTFQVVG